MLIACNKPEDSEKESSIQANLDTPKKTEIDISFLDNINKELSIIEFKDLELQTPKLQQLVNECLVAYQLKSVDRFRYTPYISKGMPFEEKLQMTITLQKIKKNRFDEIYYEDSICEWHGENYEISKKKTPEELIKQYNSKWNSITDAS